MILGQTGAIVAKQQQFRSQPCHRPGIDKHKTLPIPVQGLKVPFSPPGYPNITQCPSIARSAWSGVKCDSAGTALIPGIFES